MFSRHVANNMYSYNQHGGNQMFSKCFEAQQSTVAG